MHFDPVMNLGAQEPGASPFGALVSVLGALLFLGMAGQALPAAAAATGPILVDPEFPRSFRYASGERFFPMGDTAYYLIALPTNIIARYIDSRRDHHFNFIRMMAMADGHWPWGGTPKSPDYAVIRESAMRKLDWVFDCAAARGMNIELILFGYGVGGGEGLWADTSRQNRWIDTVVRRFQGRSNLFMITIANEFERYPTGKYSYEEGDVEWAKDVAARIRRLDPAHPIGCHPSLWITDQAPFRSYRGFSQRRPQVVWPLWMDSAVNLHVTQNNEGVQRRTWGAIDGNRRGLTYFPTRWQEVEYPASWTPAGWDFEGAGIEDCIAEDWARGKPVLNTEFGYQYEPGYESSAGYATRQAHLPSTVRKKAWKIATAGGYFAAGFLGTAVRTFTERDVDNFRPGQIESLYQFFTAKTEYWKMAPRLDLVAPHNALLALPGIEYVAYFPRGGTNSVRLSAGVYSVEWLHAETGRYNPQPDLTAQDGPRDFAPPGDPDADWVLHLRRPSVTLNVPLDGGSPRNPTNLTRVSAHRYRLRPEETELKENAWLGQFMVEATNGADSPQELTIDLVGATNRCGYVRSASGSWRRVESNESGTSLRLAIPPGRTRIASVPWFTYGEYIDYVNSLQDPRVTKEVAFTDEDGRFQVYRIRVTHPGGVRNKLKICFGKAQHAHETSAFFMSQGIIDWLLSGDPAANLDNVVWTLYPCADPKAAYFHLNYRQLEKELYDTGRTGHETYYDDISAGHHHLVQITHMWNNEGHNLEHESYEYWDPWTGSNQLVTYPGQEPDSPLYRDWLAYWPHWFEWGTDTYWHRNGRNWPALGGGALMLNEIYFFGKDSGGDVAANVRQQGKHWARAISQVYLHFQKSTRYWTDAHPCGAVDVAGAVLLPKPAHSLLETVVPIDGAVQPNRNGNGQPMRIFRKQYDHGLGMKAGDRATYAIPPGANAFQAVVALDDAETSGSATAQFVIEVDGSEVWRSRSLAKFHSEMAHVPLPSSGSLHLRVEGARGLLGNWAGAKFITNDPDSAANQNNGVGRKAARPCS